ncbi:MAG TPA: STAS domain-containing protein [Fimbriiglobus sp.]|nr:STAS domain-containing protein [Fimbriiglobus sp.]
MSDPLTFSCQFTVVQPGDVVVADLSGELIHEAAEPFDDQVAVYFRAGHRRFVFDMSRLTYIGSMGLRSLTALASRVKADGAVCLCDLTAPVQSVLDVSKLAPLLPIYTTRAEAVAAARAR